MDELITESGTVIELAEGIPIPLNLSIADFKEPEKRQRNFSKEIDLPGTANNQEYFMSAFSLTKVGGTYDFNSSAKVNCTYYKGGAPVLKNAVLKLNKVIVLDGAITFKVLLFADLVDIFLLLSGVTVGELDWSEYTHTLNNTNIQNSWTTPLGQGYYYPLIERKARPVLTRWDNTEMVPYVHLIEVFKKCMEYAGQSYTSTFLNTNRVKSILFGFGGGKYVDAAMSPTELNNRRVLTNNGVINTNMGAIMTFNGSVTHAPLFLSSHLTLTEVQDIYGQMQGSTFTAQRTGKYKLKLTGQIRHQLTSIGASYVSGGSRLLQYSRNGVLQTIRNLTQSSADQTHTLNEEVNLELNQGDVITLVLGFSQSSFTTTEPQPPTVQSLVTTPTNLVLEYESTETTLIEGSTVEIGRFLPSMKCSDFLIGFIRLFKLMITEQDISGIIRLEPEANFYQNTNIFTDISEEVDHSREIEIRPSANEYAKTLKYIFAKATETDATEYSNKWGENYGDLAFDQSSFFAKGEQKIELPFATIVPYQIYPGVIVPRFIDVDNQGQKKPTAGAPRIMFRNGMKTGAWQLRGSSTLSLNSYPCVHHFDNFENPTFDLNFKLVTEVFYVASAVTTVNTYSTYYERSVNEVISKEGKYVQLYRKMTNEQVRKLDWTRLLMWNGALFKFNKIVDFDSNITESTKIEMIKVLEARSPNRKGVVIARRLPPIWNQIVVAPPANDGGGTPVINGGPGRTLITNKVMKG
jgi:hypothetical protein